MMMILVLISMTFKQCHGGGARGSIGGKGAVLILDDIVDLSCILASAWGLHTLVKVEMWKM